MINKAKSLIAAHRRRKRALKREQAKEKSGFPKSLIFTPAPQKYRPHHSYSVVTAAYGAEHYLDEFFSSLFQQTVGFIEESRSSWLTMAPPMAPSPKLVNGRPDIPIR